MMRNSPAPIGSHVAYQTTHQQNQFSQHVGHNSNTSRERPIKHGDHFSSNQLVAYNHPSPSSTAPDIIQPHHVTRGALDFSSSKKCGSHATQHLPQRNHQPFEFFSQSPLNHSRDRPDSGHTSPPWYNTSMSSAVPTSPFPSVRNSHRDSSSSSYSSHSTVAMDASNHQVYSNDESFFEEQENRACGGAYPNDNGETVYLNDALDSNGYLISSRSPSVPYNENLQQRTPHHEGAYNRRANDFETAPISSGIAIDSKDIRERCDAIKFTEGLDYNVDPIKCESSDYSDASNEPYCSNPSSVSAGQPAYIGQQCYNSDTHGRCQSSNSSSSTPPHYSPSTLITPGSNGVDANKHNEYDNDQRSQKHYSSSNSEPNARLEKLKSSKGARGAQNLPPCRVCGNKASGLHFGVNTCEACNEFFRRSLKRGASYYCTKNRECQVYGKKRNACSYCRYQRCVEMGMSRDAIKTGRYSHKTRTEYAMEVEEFKQKEMHRAEQEKYVVLLADLVKYHDKYVKNTTRVPAAELLKHQSAYLNLYNTQREIELRHPPLSSNMINKKLLNGWSPDGEDLSLTMHDVEMTEKWLRNYINYAKNVPGFKELALPDQASLVRGTWFEFWFLGAFRGYNSDMRVVYYPNGRTFHEEEIVKVFGKEYTDFSFSLADRMVTLDVTPEEMVLIKTVCLTFPDRTPLQNKDAVERMHWMMVSCLLHTLEKNRPGDSAIFPLIVSKLVELRTLTDIAMRAHKSAIYQDVLKESPLLSEMVDTKTIYVNADPHGKSVSRTLVNNIPG
ncbi:unnamed protein product [Lymnaea stagnalis]|uniref:Uncharacterized protein n=1 Tax=Lymnaea stagnalis TaxID=6523 RepID=A0AAV2HYB4_LYMST